MKTNESQTPDFALAQLRHLFKLMASNQLGNGAVAHANDILGPAIETFENLHDISQRILEANLETDPAVQLAVNEATEGTRDPVGAALDELSTFLDTGNYAALAARRKHAAQESMKV